MPLRALLLLTLPCLLWACAPDARPPQGPAQEDGSDGRDGGADTADGSEGLDGDEGSGDGDGGEREVPPLALPLTIDRVVAHAREHGVRDAASLVSALPRLVRQNYVLMERSRSRHHARLERPRLILFTPTAHFLLGVSSDETDPLHDTVEMAELDPATGLWRFVALDLAAQATTGGPEACGPCHGVPSQPLWGSYPEWPGALGDDGGGLTREQFEVVRRLATDPATRGLFQHVPFELRDDLPAFYLPGRAYAYPNTVFNFDMGRAVAKGLWRRLRSAPGYDLRAAELVFTRFCTERLPDVPTRDLDDLLREGGVEPRQFYLQEPYYMALEANVSHDRGWNEGSASLLDIVLFLVLDDLLAARPGLRPYLAGVEEARQRTLTHGFALDDAAWAALAARADAFNYFSVYYDVWKPLFEGSQGAPLCQELHVGASGTP